MFTLDHILFIALPYVALTIFFIGTLYRYRTSGFEVSSLSSQFLEGKQLYWGAMLFHWGILIVLAGHALAFLFPKGQLLWNTHPVRLIILEVTAFTFGVCIFLGLLALLARRLTHPRIRIVTTKMDIFVELLLLAQVILGCWLALGYRWGSSWFAADISPYLWSLVKLNPHLQAVSAMPWVIKLHIAGAFLLILLIPFSRLIHFLVAPLHYIWRPYQRVIWYWDRKKVRSPQEAWSPVQPKNN